MASLPERPTKRLGLNWRLKWATRELLTGTALPEAYSSRTALEVCLGERNTQSERPAARKAAMRESASIKVVRTWSNQLKDKTRGGGAAEPKTQREHEAEEQPSEHPQTEGTTLRFTLSYGGIRCKKNHKQMDNQMDQEKDGLHPEDDPLSQRRDLKQAEQKERKRMETERRKTLVQSEETPEPEEHQQEQKEQRLQKRRKEEPHRHPHPTPVQLPDPEEKQEEEL